MSVRQDLLQQVKKAIKNIPTQRGQKPDAIEQIKKIKFFLNTLHANIESIDDSLINTLHNDHEYIMSSLNNISHDLQHSGNDLSLDYIHQQMCLIIDRFPKMCLFPYNYNKSAVENSTAVQESFDAILQYMKEQKTDWDRKLSESSKKANTLRQMFKNHERNIEKIVNDTSTRFNKAYDKQIETANQTQKRFVEQLEVYRQKIDKKHKEILAIAGIVAGDTYSAEYNKNADRERISMKFWKFLTVLISILFLCMFIGLGYIFVTDIPDLSKITSTVIIYRLGIAFPILSIAYYLMSFSSKQSRYHREKESYYRDFALKSKTIDPYISALDENLQQLLKTYVAGELFANADKTTEKNESVKSGFTKELLDKIVSLIKKENGNS